MQTSIPPLILGTMTFGDTADEGAAAELVGAALDAGITWLDTANSYSDGRCEEILGRILKGREGVTIATKVGQPQSLVGTENLLSAAKIRTSVDASLQRLGREQVELLYLHKPDRSTPLEETLGEVAALAGEGKIGALGISNYAAWQVSDVARVAEEVGAPQLSASQQMYSLLARRLEDEYEEYAVSTGLPTVIYNPLAGGLLTGRYHRDADAGSGRFGDARNAKEYRARYWDERMFSAVDALTEIANDAGIPLAEFALRWTIGRPAVQSVLLGGTRVSHLRDNIAAFGRGPLPDDVSAAADAVGDDLRGPMPAYNR